MSDPLTGPPLVEAMKAEPYQSFADLKDAHTELLKLDTQIADRSAFLDRVEDFCNRAHVTGALLGRHDDRRATQSMLNYWVATLFSGNRSPDQTILADFDDSQIAKIKDEDCPYPGSRPFRKTDAKNFYGRRTATEYISNRLKIDRLVALIGPSGRGKTSLLQAGILPALQFEDDCAGRKRFYFPLLIPGSDPLASLEGMIKSEPSDSAQPVQTSINEFRRNSKYLLELIRQVTKQPAVLLIDQFEDIFNLSPNRKIQRAFIANLLAVVQDPETSHTVILTMRNDSFDEEIKRLPRAFREQLEPAKWTVPPLGAGEIGDAIKKPAEKVGLIIHEATLLSLIKEILAEPIGLPLLQFALQKLWAKRNDRNEVPDKALTDMGGCRMAFVDTADQLYKDLKPKDQETMRRILMRMVRVDGEGTATDIPVLRTDLYQRDSRERVDHVLGRLLTDGLVRLSEHRQPADVQVELTHHSLVRAWAEMATWVETRKTALNFLRYAAMLALSLGFVFLLVLAMRGFIEWRRDEKELLSLRIAQQSEKLMGQHRYNLAMLVGLHAFRIDDNAASRSTILNALRLSPRPYKFLYKRDYEAADLAFSPDKTKLATLDKNGDISIWDIGKEPTVERVLSSSKNAAFPLLLSADGKRLASGSRTPGENETAPQSNLKIWDVTNGSFKDLFVDVVHQPTTVAFSPNGNLLVSGAADGRVIRWDLTKESPVASVLVDLDLSATAVSINPQGSLLACGTSDGSTILWKTDTWEKFKTLGGHVTKPKQKPSADTNNEPVASVAFSADGKRLVIETIADTVVWDIQAEQELLRVSTGLENIGFISVLSENGNTLTSYSGDGNVFFWDIANGGRSQLRTPLDQTWFLALSADGTLLALPDEDGITIWNLGENRPLRVPESLTDVTTLAFDPTPNSKTLAAGLNEGEILLWDSASRQQLGKLEPPNKTAATMLAFSPDGKTLAQGLFDGTVLLWNVPERSVKTEITGYNGSLIDLVFSPDGKQLARIIKPAQTEPNQFILRNLESGNEQLIETLGNVTSVAISNDGKTLFAGNTDGKVLAWEFATQTTIAEFQAEPSPIVSVRLDPTGTKLAAATVGLLNVWDVSDVAKPNIVFSSTRFGIYQLSFAREGGILGILIQSRKTTRRRDRQGGLVLLDVETGNQLGDSIPNDTNSMSFALRSDGKILASAESSLTIDLWVLEPASADTFCAVVNTNPSLEDWNFFVGRDQKYCKICPLSASGTGAPKDAKPCAYKKWWEPLAKYII